MVDHCVADLNQTIMRKEKTIFSQRQTTTITIPITQTTLIQGNCKRKIGEEAPKMTLRELYFKRFDMPYTDDNNEDQQQLFTVFFKMWVPEFTASGILEEIGWMRETLSAIFAELKSWYKPTNRSRTKDILNHAFCRAGVFQYSLQQATER